MPGTLLIIVLALLVLGAWPSWPYSRTWGYYPSSLVGLILVVIIVLVFLGRA
jgi:MFS superfamily sulfate permease-like transporter